MSRRRPVARSLFPLIALASSAILGLILGGCSALDAVNALGRSDGYTAVRDVAYGDEPRQRLDVYKPVSIAQSPRMVIVFFYGGNWRNGDRADYRFVAEALTGRGYVVVIPDYRLYPAVKFPVFVEDGAKVVAWARAHAGDMGADADGLVLMGHSAGAHIAALLALDARYLRGAGVDPGVIKAFIGLAGPYNFTPTGENRHVFETGGPGSPLAADFEALDAVDGHAPPMLLMHGQKDSTVNPDNSTALAMAVNTHGGDARVVMYKGRSHAGVVLALARGFRGLAPVVEDVDAFLRGIGHPH